VRGVTLDRDHAHDLFTCLQGQVNAGLAGPADEEGCDAERLALLPLLFARAPHQLGARSDHVPADAPFLPFRLVGNGDRATPVVGEGEAQHAVTAIVQGDKERGRLQLLPAKVPGQGQLVFQSGRLGQPLAGMDQGIHVASVGVDLLKSLRIGKGQSGLPGQGLEHGHGAPFLERARPPAINVEGPQVPHLSGNGQPQEGRNAGSRHPGVYARICAGVRDADDLPPVDDLPGKAPSGKVPAPLPFFRRGPGVNPKPVVELIQEHDGSVVGHGQEAGGDHDAVQHTIRVLLRQDLPADGPQAHLLRREANDHGELTVIERLLDVPEGSGLNGSLPGFSSPAGKDDGLDVRVPGLELLHEVDAICFV